MVKYECDHCGQSIKGVVYTLRPMSDSGAYLHDGYHLHYDCLIPWREADK